MDDGSTDPETADALRRVSGPDLRVVRTENRGLPAARNAGISLARGEYISCLDADDAFEPAWLELSVARLDGDPGVGFVSHWLELFGDETGQWTPERADLAALIDQNVFNGAALFRRELVEIVGGFDESMRNGCEDWEFWIRVMTAGYRGATIPAVLHRYRRRPDSMSRRMRTGDTWLHVYGGLLNKYPEARGEHLLDMLLRREWTIGRLCGAIDSVRQELSLNLEPALDQRRRELETARARLATATRSGRLRPQRGSSTRRSCARAGTRGCVARRGAASVVELANHRARSSSLRAAVSRPLPGRSGS